MFRITEKAVTVYLQKRKKNWVYVFYSLKYPLGQITSLYSLSPKKKNVQNNRKGRHCIFTEKKKNWVYVFYSLKYPLGQITSLQPSPYKKNVQNPRKGRHCIFAENKEFVDRRVQNSAISTRLDYLFIAFLKRRRIFRNIEKVVTLYLRKRKTLWVEGF